MSAAPNPSAPSPPGWASTLRRTVAALWLPAILPFLFSPLSECGHCVRTYLAYLPILPGFFVSVLVQLDDTWFEVVAAFATLAAIALVALLIRATGRYWWWVAGTAAALAGAQALLLGTLLRM